MLKFIAASFLLVGASALAHEGDEQAVVIESAVEEAVTVNQYTYRFQLVDTKKNAVITASDLEVSHEKLIHFIVYDPALKEFQHVHPSFDGQYWNVALNFQVSGTYWLWAQGKIEGGDDFASSNRLVVNLDQPAWPDPNLQDVRRAEDGNSQVTIGNDNLMAGQMAMLHLMFMRTDGTTPEITPYLGAFAHVTAVTQDGDSLIHVHPMEGDNANEGMLHVEFPSAGFYRIWIEFIDGGTLKTVALAVEVH